MRLEAALQDIALEQGDKLALSVCGGSSIGFAELDRRATATARGLRAAGVAKGDRVGIVSNHDVNAVVLFWAILRAGAVVVWLNNDVKATDLGHIIDDADIALVVAQSDRHVELVTAACQSSERVRRLGEVVAAEHEAGEPESFALSDRDLAAIVYTSGSSGRPKGVCLTHRNLMTVTGSVIEHMPITSADSYLMVVPLHYVHGIMQLLVHALVGATVHFYDNFVFPRKIVEALQQTAVTGFSGVPFHFSALISRGGLLGSKLPALRWLTVTGGKLDVATTNAIVDAFPRVDFHIAYGQTECAPRATALHPSRIRSKPGSVGAPIPRVEVLLLDEEGKEVAPGEAGEVVIRGDNVMQGYWRDEAATREVIDADGRLHTGDIGRFDTDGDLFLVGRKSAMIKSAGERIVPEEIERVLEVHPDVAEAVVVGVADHLYGQRVVAHVQPRAAVADAEVFITDIRAHCLESIPLARAPREYHLWEAFPRRANGKPDRVRIQAGEQHTG